MSLFKNFKWFIMILAICALSACFDDPELLGTTTAGNPEPIKTPVSSITIGQLNKNGESIILIPINVFDGGLAGLNKSTIDVSVNKIKKVSGLLAKDNFNKKTSSVQFTLTSLSDGNVLDFIIMTEGLAKRFSGVASKDQEKIASPVALKTLVSSCTASVATRSNRLIQWGGEDNLGVAEELTGLAGGTPFNQFALRDDEGLALSSDGTLWQWDGVGTDPLNFVQRQDLQNILSIASGRTHYLALDSSGSVWSWGNNSWAQIGNGQGGLGGDNADFDQAAPRKINGLANVVAIAAGEKGSLALKQDGTVLFWGALYNPDAAGAGEDTAERYVISKLPTELTALKNAKAFAINDYFIYFVKSDGTVWEYGPKKVTQVPELKNIVDIQAGSFHVLALDQDGKLWAFGKNWTGAFGNGQRVNEPDSPDLSTLVSTPVQANLNQKVTEMDAGCLFSLARTEDGQLWAWGDNEFNQLGRFGFEDANGEPTSNRFLPELVDARIGN